MALFYVEPPITPEITIEGTEAHHCLNVLRLTTGHVVQILDGIGHLYQGTITNTTKHSVQVRIEAELSPPPRKSPDTIIIMPLLKSSDKIEWILEKGTELGTSAFVITTFERSERSKYNAERFQKVVLAACKQSIRADLPPIRFATNFEKALSNLPESYTGYLATCANDVPKTTEIKFYDSPTVVFVIGPEGDLSPQEITQGANAGFQFLDLGQQRLRSETACLHVLSLAHYARTLA
jgi:16S rRNA (uracil1498-N3)-methyltransferase